MESHCKALLKYSTFHKKSLWWKLTSFTFPKNDFDTSCSKVCAKTVCKIEVTSGKIYILLSNATEIFSISWRFHKPLGFFWGGGGDLHPGAGLKVRLRATVAAADGKALFFHAFVLPLTQLRLYCHWNSAYLGFHSNSVLTRPSSVSTWCLPLSWSIASVSLKDPLRKSLSGLSY